MDLDKNVDLTVLKYPLDILKTHGPLGMLRRFNLALYRKAAAKEKPRKIYAKMDRFLCNAQKYLDSKIDKELGIETSGMIPLSNLSIKGNTKDQGIWYEPMPVKIFRQIISQVHVDVSDYTFVDFGSGKGRVLILAAEFGFYETIGVEFAKEIYEISCKNISKYLNRINNKRRITALHLDAIDFKLPDSKLILFFYSPFRGKVLERVIDNIRQSYQENPRHIITIFYGRNSDSLNLFESKGFWLNEIRVSADWRHFTKYRAFIITINNSSSLTG